jgi:hypothetical protein
MIKDKHFVSDVTFVIVVSVSALLFLILSYFFIGWLSEIGIKKYDKQPEFSLAPHPIEGNDVAVHKFSSSCYEVQTHRQNSVYEVNRAASEVEAYYHQEMSKYCLASDAQNFGFTSDLCLGTLADVGTRDCRYASCKLKDESPSLLETFSVEIFEISASETAVVQVHEIRYRLKVSSNIPCGE